MRAASYEAASGGSPEFDSDITTCDYNVFLRASYEKLYMNRCGAVSCANVAAITVGVAENGSMASSSVVAALVGSTERRRGCNLVK